MSNVQPGFRPNGNSNSMGNSRNPLGVLNVEGATASNSEGEADRSLYQGLNGLDLNKSALAGNSQLNATKNRIPSHSGISQKQFDQYKSKGRKMSDGGHRWLFGLRSRSVSSPAAANNKDDGYEKGIINDQHHQHWARGQSKHMKKQKEYLEKKYIQQQQNLYKGKRAFSTSVVNTHNYYQESKAEGFDDDEDINRKRFYSFSDKSLVDPDLADAGSKVKCQQTQHKPLTASQKGSMRGKPSIVSTSTLLSKDTGIAKSDRILCFDRIPDNVGLNSIISQVSGGPLERVVNVGAESSSNPRIVQIHFCQAADAMTFYEYTTSGRFMINGTSYMPRWGNASLATIYSFPKIVYDEMMFRGARRCINLTLKRRDNGNPFGPGIRKIEEGREEVKHNADCTVSYMPSNGVGATGGSNWKPKAMVSSRNIGLNVSLETIWRDFGKFGEILSVFPLILHHVNISIQYADVEHAIRAKKTFERQFDEEMSKRYEDWTISYGKDPTDRRVPVPL